MAVDDGQDAVNHFRVAPRGSQCENSHDADEYGKPVTHQKVCPMLKKTLKWLACRGSKTVTLLTVFRLGKAGGFRFHPKAKVPEPTGASYRTPTPMARMTYLESNLLPVAYFKQTRG